MRFQVPQFLEIEDKIFGPFTFKQFAYLAGGAGICYVIYKLLGFWLGAIPIILIGSFSAALTFYKPNGKPFINMVEAWIKYSIQDKLYIWQRRISKKSKIDRGEDMEMSNKKVVNRVIKLDKSKLRDLAWSLDVLDLKK